MSNQHYLVEESTPFSESLIWQLNRSFYETEGIDAWREGDVPFNSTSNSMVGKTYAELIFGALKDLGIKGQTTETVYIIELGAGHGRLAFHILVHLERLINGSTLELPPFCYVLSDIVADNLNFFVNHPQFQPYIERGLLEVAYFDAIGSTEIQLVFSKKIISSNSLEQPLIAIANYFFDSIPTDLFYLKNKEISSCSISLSSEVNPEAMNSTSLIDSINISYQKQVTQSPFYSKEIYNEIIQDYQNTLFDTYLFFPEKSFQCIHHLQGLAPKGLILFSMDKGYYELHNLESKASPEMIVHKSMSFWVNFHALGAFCKKNGGKAIFPDSSSFNLELACLMFVENSDAYPEMQSAYQRFVNDFGPNDYNNLKKMTYRHIATMTLPELLPMIRLSSYDSSFFVNVLPRIKQLARRISFEERVKLSKCMHQVWAMYFTFNETFDLGYEMGGLFYDLGFHQEALVYFKASTQLFGPKADVFYNQILCHYQLRQDELFAQTLIIAKSAFPEYEQFAHLEKLDLEA